MKKIKPAELDEAIRSVSLWIEDRKDTDGVPVSVARLRVLLAAAAAYSAMSKLPLLRDTE